MNRLFYGYLVLINVIVFAMYAWDKYRAIRGHWRIPEKQLLFAALLGGSPAALFAMYLFQHKAKHLTFTWGVPIILLLQLGAGYWLLFM